MHKLNIKHGKYNTRLHSIWNSMITRCYSKHRKSYKNYGGRGIVVCIEWRNDFMTFYNWAYENGYNDKLTLDRINNDGNYEPNNCRWVDYKTQARNRRSNKMFTINDETHCLMEWCEILNVNYWKAQARVKKLGYTIEQALGLEERCRDKY